MSLTLPFGFISSQGPKPFDFQFVENLTNIGVMVHKVLTLVMLEIKM